MKLIVKEGFKQIVTIQTRLLRNYIPNVYGCEIVKYIYAIFIFNILFNIFKKNIMQQWFYGKNINLSRKL